MTPRVRVTLESRWERAEGLRGLDLACADIEWAHRTVQPQKTAQEGSAAGWRPSVRAVQPPSHVPDAAR